MIDDRRGRGGHPGLVPPGHDVRVGVAATAKRVARRRRRRRRQVLGVHVLLEYGVRAAYTAVGGETGP